jgi:hypothetical protein
MDIMSWGGILGFFMRRDGDMERAIALAPTNPEYAAALLAPRAAMEPRQRGR